MTNQKTKVHLNPKKILIGLLGIIGILVGLSIYGQKIRFFGVADIRGASHEFFLDLLMQAFYLDTEGNISTHFNALLLFIPALLLILLSMWKSSNGDKFRLHWLGLGLIFLFLSFDEAAGFHERLIKPMRAILNTGGIFHFAWIIPGMIVVALFGLTFLAFFLHLEKKFKILFFISLAVYIGGVIGGEMISGYYASKVGQKAFAYAVAASFEESIEMIGCSLIIYSLLEYIKNQLPDGLTVKLT